MLEFEKDDLQGLLIRAFTGSTSLGLGLTAHFVWSLGAPLFVLGLLLLDYFLGVLTSPF